MNVFGKGTTMENQRKWTKLGGKKKHTTISLPPTIDERLSKLAKETGRSRSNIVSEALLRTLPEE